MHLKTPKLRLIALPLSYPNRRSVSMLFQRRDVAISAQFNNAIWLSFREWMAFP